MEGDQPDTTPTQKLVKRPWTAEEDEALTACVAKYGAGRWSMIATLLETGRVGKQCRERWNNHLSPDVKKDDWSSEEDRAILEGAATLGTRWCEIIKNPALVGRTDNSIKNRFYALQRRMKARQQAAREFGSCGEIPKDEQQRTRVFALASSIATTTDEDERDRLIEELTIVLHGCSPVFPHSEPNTGSDAPVPESSPDELTVQDQGFLDDLLEPNVGEISAIPKSKPLHIALPSLPEIDSPLSPTSSSDETLSTIRSTTSSRATSPITPPDLVALPSPAVRRLQREKASLSSHLGGRHLRKALLSPLVIPQGSPAGKSPLPLSNDSFATDSPKRQRTPSGWCPSVPAASEGGKAVFAIGTKEPDAEEATPLPPAPLLSFGKRRASHVPSPLAVPAAPEPSRETLQEMKHGLLGSPSLLSLNVFADLFATETETPTSRTHITSPSWSASAMPMAIA